MMKRVSAISALAILMTTMPLTVSAATIDMFGVASATNDTSDSDDFFGGALFRDESGESIERVPAGANNDASYEISADARTGELKFNLGAERVGVGASAGASAEIRVEEMLTVNGTGTLTARMQVDAVWAVADRYNFVSLLQFFGSGVSVVDQFAPDDNTSPNLRSADEMLEVSVSFTEAIDRQIGFASRLGGSIFVGVDSTSPALETAFMDASNTATFALFATEGLTFTTSDGFLSDPAFGDDDPTTPAVIPVPASLPLLLAGLFGIGALRRRR